MLELRLRSGEIATFDGRILEVFASSGTGERLHVAHIEATRAVFATGASAVSFGSSRVRLRFAREEAPACARLLAAIEQAQQADAEPAGSAG